MASWLSFLSGLVPKAKTQTGSLAQTSDTSSSVTKNLTPFQSALQSPLFNYITNLLSADPSTIAKPYQTAAANDINANYTGLADTLRNKFLATGGGDSGKYGLAVAQGEQQRLSDLSTSDSDILTSVLGQRAGAAELGSTLLGQDFGSTSSSDTSGQENGSSSSLTYPI
jgi:hypothetical protein